VSKPKLVLHPSEGIVAQCAATIYAAYITSGKVAEGDEKKWIKRSVKEAFKLCHWTDEAIESDKEIG